MHFGCRAVFFVSAVVFFSLMAGADAVDPNSPFGKCMTKYCWPGGESCDSILCPEVTYGCSIPCGPIYTNYGSACVEMCDVVLDKTDECSAKYAGTAYPCFSSCIKAKNSGECAGKCLTSGRKAYDECRNKATTSTLKKTTTTKPGGCDNNGICQRERGESCQNCERDCGCNDLKCSPGTAGATSDGCFDPCQGIDHAYYDKSSDDCKCQKGYEMNNAKSECVRLKGGVKGAVTDGQGRAMPYVKLTLEFEGKTYDAYADKDGKFEIKSVEGLIPDDKKPPEASLTVYMTYWRSGKNYINMVGVNTPITYLTKKFKLKASGDLNQNIDFNLNAPRNTQKWNDGDVEYSSDNNIAALIHYAVVYHYTADAVEFSLTTLKANIDYKLPVDVFIDGVKTYYSPANSDIVIGDSDAVSWSTNRPKNREYHEFSHHIMYSEYGAWPDGRSESGVKNHWGYLNPNTGDSYLEGFAEFMALIMSEYIKDPDTQPADVYAGFGSMEDNYRTWDNRGRSEEFAVCGVLWDLHDKKNEENDTVSLTFEEMWPVLKVKRKNFYEYYQAFKKAFPDKADGIDRIFIMHGFFADKTFGNRKRDGFEPYIDSPPPSNNSKYDLGEYFVDYGANLSDAEIHFESGDVIGRAADYNRTNRSMAGEIPNAFIKVPDTQVQYYKVKVHYNNPSQGQDYEYITEVRQGLVYLMPRPGNVDATLTVTPDSQDYSTEKPYVINNLEYVRKINAAPDDQGYADTHAFALKPTGTHKDKPVQKFNGVEPAWAVDAGYDVKAPEKPKPTPPEPNPGCCGPALPLLLTLLAAALTKAARL